MKPIYYISIFSILFLFTCKNSTLSQIPIDLLKYSNIEEIKVFYSNNDSILIENLVKFQLPDTIHGLELMYEHSYSHMDPSVISCISCVSCPSEFSSLKLKSIYYIMELIDSNFYNYNNYYTIILDSTVLKYDYLLSKDLKEYRKKNCSSFSKEVSNSLVYYKNKIYYILEEELLKWYDKFKSIGLKEVRKNKILPFDINNIEVNKKYEINFNFKR